MVRLYTMRWMSLAAIAGLCNASSVEAQYFRSSDYWKTHRSEISLGVGVTNFLGELGGRDKVGAPFIWDLDISSTSPALSLGYRYFLLEKLSMRFNATYGVLSGNDALTDETFRQNRNLSFRSNLFEGQFCLEYHLRLEKFGHVYNLRGVQSSAPNPWGFYLFAGIGGYYYEPTASYNGKWVDLRPLGTEGQGLEGGPEPYELMGICVPMGAGARKALSKQVTIGFEVQYSMTFSDYLDDVSGDYYDNDAILAANGPIAAYFADPSLGDVPGQTATGQQRGQPDNNDAYLFLKAQVQYKFFKYQRSNKKYRTRTKKQKIIF